MALILVARRVARIRKRSKETNTAIGGDMMLNREQMAGVRICVNRSRMAMRYNFSA
jgi:hypothetical protein